MSRGQDANLLSVGAVDFGIIVDSAVILVENIFRNFQLRGNDRRWLLGHLFEGFWGEDDRSARRATAFWTNRLRLIFISVLQVDKAVFFTAMITVTAFLPLFTMTGVEGQIFGPMARTYAYALAGALIATFTVTPVLASLVLPEHVEETETWSFAPFDRLYARRCASRSTTPPGHRLGRPSFFQLLFATRLGSEFLPALEEGNYWIRASMPPTISLDAGSRRPTRCAKSCCAIPRS